MTRRTERSLSLFGRLFILAFAFAAVLAFTTLAGAQTTTPMVQTTTMTQGTVIDSSDPNTWATAFDGVNQMGPYAWVDGPTYLQKDPQLANGVFVGQVGDFKIYVARARQSDGTHPGKFYNGTCSISWGGKEVLLTSGYDLLVNTQPQNA